MEKTERKKILSGKDKMKKALIRAFVSKNLGDDLFIYILCKRYPNTHFYITGPEKNRYIEDIAENLTFISVDSVFGKICNKIYKIKLKFQKIFMLREEAVLNFLSFFFKNNILISGSFFIESPYWDQVVRDRDWYKRKPFIIGCNFGPYINESYKELYKVLLKDAKQVCFRDKVSYDMFPDLSNVSYAPDIVFNLQEQGASSKVEDEYYIISVIDVKKDDDKKLSQVEQKYEEILCTISKNLLAKGKRIVFMSFCSRQGDDAVIDRIMKQLDSNQVETFYYEKEGIYKSLELFQNCQGVVASRYHGIILGMLYRKDILPISYSDKTINVLADLNYEGQIIDLLRLSEIDMSNMDLLFGRLEDEKLQEVIQNAKKHFEMLDKVLH